MSDPRGLPPEIAKVELLQPRPGDVLVFSFGARLPNTEQARSVRDHLRAELDRVGVRNDFIMLDHGITLSMIRADNADPSVLTAEKLAQTWRETNR